MHSFIRNTALLFSLVSSTFAAPPEYGGQNYCYTQMMSTKGHLHYTTWKTSSCTKTSTTTVVSTSSPTTVSTSTITSTITSTAPSTTNTATTITTETSTTTTTVDTSTVVLSTTTIDALLFTPVQTSVPTATYVQGATYQPPNKKRSLDLDLPLLGQGSSLNNGYQSPANPGYPGPVTCWRFPHKCHTTVSTSTSTYTRTTQTSVSTVTTTSTVVTTPGVATTVTSTTSTTITDTTTSTSTSISTVTTSVSTTVAASVACETTRYSNYANYIDYNYQNAVTEAGIVGVYTEDQAAVTFSTSSAGDDSEYDCCVAAYVDPAGVVFAYYPDGTTGSKCSVGELSSGQCTVGQDTSIDNVLLFGYANQDPHLVAGNAACGEYTATEGD